MTKTTRTRAWIAGIAVALLTFVGAFATLIAAAGAAIGPPRPGRRR